MATAAKEQQHIETATERYLRLQGADFEGFLEDSFKSAELKKAVLHDITTQSGMQWQVRRLSNEFYGAAGSIPMSLATRLKQSREEGSNTPPLTSAEEGQMIQFASKAVRFGCVHPRLVDKDVKDAGPDELPYDLISMGDFKELSEFLIGEGKEAARLGSFRRKR